MRDSITVTPIGEPLLFAAFDAALGLIDKSSVALEFLSRRCGKRDDPRFECAVAVLRRQPDEFRQLGLKFGINLRDIIGQRGIRRRQRPSVIKTRIQPILVARKCAGESVGLEPTDDAE
jgi:hypothetical protein